MSTGACTTSVRPARRYTPSPLQAAPPGAEDRPRVLVVDDQRTFAELLAGALEAAVRGVRTGGDARIREHLVGRVRSRTSDALDAVCHDPQTSGGLLAAVAPTVADDLVEAGFVAIGEIAPGPPAVALT